MYLILWGLFQKMVIADRVAVMVNHVFDQYYIYGSVELILASFGFAIQIYCDFASYSIIAKGAAQILGFHLMENFNTPYFSKSIKEFWRRWHISLSGWFKDYLYIPLGGNRCSKLRNYINILIVFGISGLWHGANWTYIIWGGIHGLYQIIGEQAQSLKLKLHKVLGTPIESFSYKLGQLITTWCLVSFSWIFFRAKTIGEAIDYIGRIFLKPNLWVFFDGSLYTLGLDRGEINILVFSMVLLFGGDLVRYVKNCQIDIFIKRQCIWFQWLFAIGIIWMIFVFGQYGPNMEMSQFIYFQF